MAIPSGNFPVRELDHNSEEVNDPITGHLYKVALPPFISWFIPPPPSNIENVTTMI